MKDLTTGQYRLIYEQPVYPLNLYLERKPHGHAPYRSQVTEPQAKLTQERGIWVPPASQPDPEPGTQKAAPPPGQQASRPPGLLDGKLSARKRFRRYAFSSPGQRAVRDQLVCRKAPGSG